MATLFRSYGMEAFEKDPEELKKLIYCVVRNGTEIPGYYGMPYLFTQTGTSEIWVNIVPDEKGPKITGFHTHAQGNCVWRMVCSDIDISPKHNEKLERILIMHPLTKEPYIYPDFMLPVNIINADVLPSFLKGDILTLQLVAPCVEVNYYATEEEFDADPSTNPNVRKWLREDGKLAPIHFMRNHNPEVFELGKEYDTDLLVHFRARVKRLEEGKLMVGGGKDRTFTRCIAETRYGELDFIHTVEQVPEKQRENIRVGSIISGTCVLSADAAIYEYKDGFIKDFSHDLLLLRYAMQRGEAERLRSVLTEDTVYEATYYGKTFVGPDAIIERFRAVHENHKGQYIAHLAEITGHDSPGLEFPVGSKCIVLASEEEDNYESIVFMNVDQDGSIARIVVTSESGYVFSLIHDCYYTSPLELIHTYDGPLPDGEEASCVRQIPEEDLTIKESE